MKTKLIVSSLAIICLPAISNIAMAISTPVTIDFNALSLASYAGKANLAPVVSPLPLVNGNCPGTGSIGCYYEDGMAVGIVKDSSNPIAHYHNVSVSLGNKRVAYHNDSTGIYVRAKDSSAFSLTAMDFLAAFDAGNPDSGPDDYWEIIGFNTAFNPTLDTDLAPVASQVAYQTVTNGFDGTVTLNSSFGNINAFWIHYHGYQQSPVDPDEIYDANGDLISNGPLQLKQFYMNLDNVKVAAPVPVPGAVWLFASAMLGLVGVSRNSSIRLWK